MKIQKEVDKAIKDIAKNPTNVPNSMELFGEPSPEELKNWVSKTKPEIIDLVFEYLYDKNCLNKKGKKLANDFWEKYIKE